MNMLVSGATGFIGNELIKRLLKDAENIVVLTRDGKRLNKSLKEKIKVYEADICDLASLERLTPVLRNIDVVFHLAASLDYFGKKEKLFQVNVKGTENLLELAEEKRIRKFIFTSSIEAMGLIRMENIPVDESFSGKPVSPYGESKLEAEKQVRRFAKEESLNTVILRLGNVYGPGSSAFIVPIANAILRKDKLLRFLHVYEDRYLHPVYIEDVAEGIMKAVQKVDENGTYILAGEEYVTIGTLFELIAQALNVDIDLHIKKINAKDRLYLNLREKIHRFRKRADLLTYFTAGEGERVHRAYSIEKAKKELSYSPKVSLKDGIVRTLNWAEREDLLNR